MNNPNIPGGEQAPLIHLDADRRPRDSYKDNEINLDSNRKNSDVQIHHDEEEVGGKEDRAVK
jgi:hypothetical protein